MDYSNNALTSIKKVEKHFSGDILGMVYMFLASLSYFSLNIIIKEKKEKIDYKIILYLRFFCLFIFAKIMLNLTKGDPYENSFKDVKVNFIRNLCGLFGTLTIGLCSTKIPVSEVFIIYMNLTTFTCILDFFIFNSKYTCKILMLTLLSYFGVILTLYPNILIKIESNNVHGLNSKEYALGWNRLFYQILIIFATFCMSLSGVIFKFIPKMNVLVQALEFGYQSCLILGILLISHKFSFDNIRIEELSFIIISMFTFGIISHIAFARAFQIGKPGKVAIISNFNIIFSFVYEIIFLREIPYWPSFIGSSIVIFSIANIMRTKS